MEYYVDWNCKLLPSSRVSDRTVSNAIETMQYLYQRDGFSKFCIVSEYTGTEGSIPAYLVLRNRAERELRERLPKHLKLRVESTVQLSPDLHTLDGLECLCRKNTNRLALTLPLSPYADWMESELNRLLYRSHFQLLFLSFELPVLFYPEDLLQRLMRIPNAVYQFGYRSLSDARVLKQIRRLLHIHSRAPILLGTSVSSVSKASFHETSYYLEQAARGLSPSEYQLLLHCGRAFWDS